MITHSISTIGSNTLKGMIADLAWKQHREIKEVIAQEHLFIYDDVHPNLHLDDIVDDIAWLYHHGATKVTLNKRR